MNLTTVQGFGTLVYGCFDRASDTFFSVALIDKTEYGDYTTLKQQLRRFLDEVYEYKRFLLPG